MNKIWQRAMAGLLTVMIVILSGCEPLGKKFVRKKKTYQTEEKVDIVFEPTEYLAPLISPIESYTHHYGVWKSWVTDVLVQTEENVSEKRIAATWDNILIQISQMRIFLNSDLQGRLDEYALECRNLFAEFHKPAPLRNKTILLNRIRLWERDFKNTFSPSKVQDFLVDPYL